MNIKMFFLFVLAKRLHQSEKMNN